MGKRHPRQVVLTVALTPLLTLAVLFATSIGWVISRPLCGQVFTPEDRAGPLSAALLVTLLLAAIPLGTALRDELSRRRVLLGTLCAVVILTGPVTITALDLTKGTLSGDYTCETR